LAGNENSGRKGRHIEVRIQELSAICINWAIKNWHNFTKEEKLRLSIVLGPKYVVQKTENTGVPQQNIIIIRAQDSQAAQPIQDTKEVQPERKVTVPVYA